MGACGFDLRSEFKRMDSVKAEKGYQGPVVVCAVYFKPVSGYIPERYAIKYLAQLRDAEIWLAPIAGTRVLVPFRFSLPTPVGTGVAPGDAIHLGGKTAACRSQRESAVKQAASWERSPAADRGPQYPAGYVGAACEVPAIHRRMSLDSPEIPASRTR